MHDILDRLKKMSRDVQGIVKTMIKYNETIVDPIDNVYLMEKHCVVLGKRINELPPGAVKDELTQWIAIENKRINENKEEFRIQFGQKLHKLFKEKGIEIKGQYPLLRVGMFTLKLDFEFGQVTLFFGPEIDRVKSGIAIHPQVVFKTVLDQDKALRSMDRTPEEYLIDLYHAYMRVLQLHKQSFGERTLITEVLREFIVMQQSRKFFMDPQKVHYREFSRNKLAFILYQIKQAGASERGLHFHVATFDATTNKLQSFWIPENEQGEGTHYSMVSFEKQIEQDRK